MARLCGLVIVVVAAALFGCSDPGATTAEESARKIAKGMSEAQVQQILGAPTRRISETMPAPVNLTLTIWRYEGEPPIGVVFENGKVGAVKVDDEQIVGP